MAYKCISLLLFIFLACTQISHAYPTYEEYLHDFNKTYSSQEEITKRKQIYDSRVVYFPSITDYQPGVNNFTDWTDQQLQKIKNFNSLTPEDIIQNFQPVKDTSYLKVSSQPVPQSLDWRSKRAVTSIKNQGTECGACWAFAVTAYVESKLIIEKNYSRTVDLSEQYLVSCTPKSNCTGGWITQALQVVARGGIPYEVSYPYDPYGSVDPGICFSRNKVQEAGSKYRAITNPTDEQLINLLQYGPVAVPISSNNWYLYQAGVYTCPNVGTMLDHAVLLVGYTNSTWIIKNQWGSQWGESGYIRINRSRASNYSNCLLSSYAVYLDPTNVVESSQRFLRPYAIGLLFILLALVLL